MKKSRALLLFAKAPVAGQVKTRLQPEFSAQQAAQIHQQLIEYTIGQIKRLKRVDVQLYCSPDDKHSFFQYLKAIYQLPLYKQAGEDLGERMSHALFNALLEYEKVILIGSDVPSITPAYIDTAYKRLETHDIVIGPAEDGGYGLVGLTSPKPLMFDSIEWGSEKVLEQTIERLSPDYPVLLDTIWDVDRPEDVQRFKKLLKPRFS